MCCGNCPCAVMYSNNKKFYVFASDVHVILIFLYCNVFEYKKI